LVLYLFALFFCSECSFVSKALKAEEAGAIAIVICDSDPDEAGFFIEMINDVTGRDSSIPAGFLLGKNGYAETFHSQIMFGVGYRDYH
jgi:hypothetical protein